MEREYPFPECIKDVELFGEESNALFRANLIVLAKDNIEMPVAEVEMCKTDATPRNESGARPGFRPDLSKSGRTDVARIIVRNTSETTWTIEEGSYQLAVLNDEGGFLAGMVPIAISKEMPAKVAPGGVVPFEILMTAPATEGTYNLESQMIEESAGVLFGEPLEVIVEVGTAARLWHLYE